MPIECFSTFEDCLFGEIKPEEGNTLSPWVKITLDNPTAPGSGGSITVGNESFPGSPHTACIKEFEYGKSDSFSMRITIHDEQGGSFVNFAEALLKDYRCNVAPMFMFVEYGWVKSFCDQNAAPINSTKAYAMLQSIETHFDGKFQFELTGTDVFTIGQEGNSDELIGGDGEEGEYYTDAIRKLVVNSDIAPTVGSVNWYEISSSGELESLEGKDVFYSPTGDPKEMKKGPKRKWQSAGQDKLDVVYRWTGTVEHINRKKGWTLYFNNEVPEGELQIWLDSKPSGQESGFGQCMGTYIVNGGKESPVISFNPSFKWDFTRLTSGGGNLSTSSTDPTGDQAKTKGRREFPTLSRVGNPGAGHNTTGATQEENTENESGPRGQDDAQSAADKQFRALDLAGNIEADLTIIGDPRLKPLQLMNRFISIIFINPYHLQTSPNSGTSACPDWTIAPPCNPVLSNDSWIVKAITHKIEAGKYTTTLRVKLTAPGSDIDANQRLGGSQNGWQPPPGCPEAT